MADGAQVAKSGLVIGTSHAYQRHQDHNLGREEIRNQLEKIIRETVEGRKIDFIGEEAGSKEKVHAHLKADETKMPAFDILFADTKTADEPQETIARLVADELLGGRYVDILPPDADFLPHDADANAIAKRNDAMMAVLAGRIRDATSILVICGDKHRAGLAKRIGGYGFRVDQKKFPENLDSDE